MPEWVTAYVVPPAFVVAGIVLVRTADAIAELTGLGKLLVGSILLAGATSLPELMIGLNAVWLELPDIAVGDLVGSSLFNLLILALADLVHRRADDPPGDPPALRGEGVCDGGAERPDPGVLPRHRAWGGAGDP